MYASEAVCVVVILEQNGADAVTLGDAGHLDRVDVARARVRGAEWTWMSTTPCSCAHSRKRPEQHQGKPLDHEIELSGRYS